MASHLGATPRAALLPSHKNKHTIVLKTQQSLEIPRFRSRSRGGSLRIRVSNDGASYLDMWKKAVDGERKAIEFQRIAENPGRIDGGEGEESEEALEKKSSELKKILEVSKEKRDRVQLMQVIDRAAAAIAAARAILKESSDLSEVGSVDSGFENSKSESGGGMRVLQGGNHDLSEVGSVDSGFENSKSESGGGMRVLQGGTQSGNLFTSHSGTSVNGTPGPDFWSWTPPLDSDRGSDNVSNVQTTRKNSLYQSATNSVIEREQSVDFLSIPFESKLTESNHNPPLPPLQSLMEVEKEETNTSSLETPSSQKEHELGLQFSAHATEAAHALDKVDEASSYGVNPDGSRCWRETGVEQRPGGVVFRWTLTRGVSADRIVEWEEKFWEAADEFDYKELGSEKSGRDATGNVWHEYWKESMWQDRGLVHFEKTADKWGKNGKGDEWQEKWWEHYDASSQAEKWAHKWCSIDPNTPLEAGHAHIWHERWGEKYDGRGGSMKYTDKWAERSEGDGWMKWGDKWDENFDSNSHGVKQGETWWEGKHGKRWNRTWGERHNGSGWVHKYGKSSSREHWDTHVEQDTWYERYPHFGFMHCFENSVQLRGVQKPSEKQSETSETI